MLLSNNNNKGMVLERRGSDCDGINKANSGIAVESGAP